VTADSHVRPEKGEAFNEKEKKNKRASGGGSSRREKAGWGEKQAKKGVVMHYSSCF